MTDKADIVERLKETAKSFEAYTTTGDKHGDSWKDNHIRAKHTFLGFAAEAELLTKRIAELEAEVERYRDKERRKAHAEKLRDWNLRREYATNKWISADRARIHKEAQRRGWKGGEPAEPYVPKELVEKIRRVYGYLKRRADRDFLRANPKPVLEPPHDPA